METNLMQNSRTKTLKNKQNCFNNQVITQRLQKFSLIAPAEDKKKEEEYVDLTKYKGIYFNDDNKKFQDEDTGAHF